MSHLQALRSNVLVFSFYFLFEMSLPASRIFMCFELEH